MTFLFFLHIIANDIYNPLIKMGSLGISLSFYHANMSVQCRAPYTPFLYSKPDVYMGIHFS